jgi:hypothetical protein
VVAAAFVLFAAARGAMGAWAGAAVTVLGMGIAAATGSLQRRRSRRR